MGREIRRVPADWQHPKVIYEKENTREPEIGYRPMYQGDYSEAIAEWGEELGSWLSAWEEWQQGLVGTGTISQALATSLGYIRKRMSELKAPDFYNKVERTRYETGICSFTDYFGDAPAFPNPENYMPTGDWYQLFENVSEGTPLSPPFATPDELIEWLAHNRDFWQHHWSREQAESIVRYKWAPSAVTNNGRFMTGVEALVEKHQKDSTP